MTTRTKISALSLIAALTVPVVSFAYSGTGLMGHATGDANVMVGAESRLSARDAKDKASGSISGKINSKVSAGESYGYGRTGAMGVAATQRSSADVTARTDASVVDSLDRADRADLTGSVMANGGSSASTSGDVVSKSNTDADASAAVSADAKADSSGSHDDSGILGNVLGRLGL